MKTHVSSNELTLLASTHNLNGPKEFIERYKVGFFVHAEKYTSILRMDDLTVLIEEEKNNGTNKENSVNHLFLVYLRYTTILHSLDETYSSILNPQQRLLIKEVIIHIIVRLIDLRHKITQDSNHDIDIIEQLEEHCLSSAALEFATVPCFCREDASSSHRKERDELIQGYMRLKHDVNHLPVEEDDSRKDAHGDARIDTPLLTEDEGVKECERRNWEPSEDDKDMVDAAIVVIQRYARGFVSRIHFHRKKEEHNVLIGIQSPSSRTRKNKSLQQDLCRRTTHNQRQNDAMYRKQLQDIHANVERREQEIREGLREERITWLMEHIVESNTVPDTLEGFYEKENVSEEETNECNDDVVDSSGQDRCISIIDSLDKAVKNYYKVTRETMDDEVVLSYDKEQVLNDKIETERRQVDDMIMTNIRRIKSLHPDSSNPPPTNNNNASKAKKQTSSKGKTKSKSKKDMLPGEKQSSLKNMDTSQMLSILVEHNIVNNPRNISVGDVVNSGSKKFDLTMLYQVKKILTEDCIWPLCCQSVRDKMDESQNLRSILFYGPEGNGKTALAQAVAYEVGAMFINLTHIENIFNEKNGATKLIHMAFTVARDPLYAPVVIYIDKCERFFKSNKKKKSSGPERFMKDLLIYKNQSLKLDHRVIVIGCSSCPWEADLNSLRWKGSGGKAEKQGFFEKFLFINKPNYFDRLLLFQTFIEERIGDLCHELNFSSLAQFSSGQSVSAIKTCIHHTLTPHRIALLHIKTLDDREFLDRLPQLHYDDITNTNKPFDDFSALVGTNQNVTKE